MFTSLWSRNIVETQAGVFFLEHLFGQVTNQINSSAVLFGVSPSSRPGQPLLQGFARFLWGLGWFSEPAQATGDAMHMRVNSYRKKGQKYVCGIRKDKVHTLQAASSNSICSRANLQMLRGSSSETETLNKQNYSVLVHNVPTYFVLACMCFV